MKHLALALIMVFALTTGLHAEQKQKNIFNQHVKLNSCENFDPLAPLVAEVIKETRETAQEALDEGLSPETILQMARNAKCTEFILPVVEEFLQGAQPYTPEAGPITVPQTEHWEHGDVSPNQP